jgi:hypothetical protein
MNPRACLLIGALVLLSPMPALAGIACPSKIEVDYELAVPQPGWTEGRGKQVAGLIGLDVYSGSEPVPLMHDKEGETEKTRTISWGLPKNQRGYWINFRYVDSLVGLTRKLPDSVTRCEVVYYRNLSYSTGELAVQSMDCGPAE